VVEQHKAASDDRAFVMNSGGTVHPAGPAAVAGVPAHVIDAEHAYAASIRSTFWNTSSGGNSNFELFHHQVDDDDAGADDSATAATTNAAVVVNVAPTGRDGQ